MVRNAVRGIRPNFPKAQVIIYNVNREIPDVIAERDLFLFGPEDFTMFWKKKPMLEEWFSKHQFDLLINFDNGKDSVRNALFSEIRADFKVGPHIEKYADMYNMMIEKTKKKMDYQEYFEQTLHYLTVLNIK